MEDQGAEEKGRSGRGHVETPQRSDGRAAYLAGSRLRRLFADYADVSARSIDLAPVAPDTDVTGRHSWDPSRDVTLM